MADAAETNIEGSEDAEKCKHNGEKSIISEKNDDEEDAHVDNDDDEPPERSTYAEERFRVDRKKLEAFLQDEKDSTSSDGNFFHKIEQATNTKISWPAKLKIGAKSRKDPYIKVAGLPEERQAAKQMILSVMDSKSSRVTLKMDVSFADHSHVIGKGGNTIKKVMRDTQCHIHFPDSNRTSSEKSNQVSIAGPPFNVESARRQIRELLPIVLKFEIPAATTIPDSSSPVITNIAQMHNVTISFQPQPRTYGYFGCVKGLHSDPFAVRDAILKVFEQLTGTVPVTVPVTTQIEIDPKHHIFIRGHNGSNIKNISQATGASIHLPDPNDTSCRKSTITITGTIESAVTAKVYLLQNLPLILMFDIRDGEHDHVLEQGMLNKLMEMNDVQICVKPKLKQCCKSVIVKGHEIKAPNIYKTRLHLIGEDASNMPYLCAPLPTLMMPPATPPLHIFKSMMQPPPPLPVSVPTTYPVQSGPLTPPMQSSSPLINNTASEGGLPSQINPLAHFINVVPAGQRIIGSEMKMKRLSVDGLFGIIKKEKYEKDKFEGRKRSFSGIVQPTSYLSNNSDVTNSQDGLSNARSADSILDDLMSKSQNNSEKDVETLVSNGSWSGENGKKATTKHVSTTSIDSGLSQSQEDLNNSTNLSMTTHLINKLALQRTPNFNPSEYETCKKMAENAMHGQISFSKARTPTDAWSGMGFSNSMPGAVLKEVWNNLEKNQQQPIANGGVQSRLQNSPSGSLDSSVSSSGSSVSSMHASSIHSFGQDHHSPPGNKPVRPPPGLEDSHPYMDNALLLNNNYDYGSLLSSPEPVITSAYTNVKCISDLFRMLGVEQYTEAFEKEEVDLMTFVSLTDDDLKELGVTTFGARKKMLNAMRELQALHGQPSSLNTNMHIPLSLASNFASGYYSSRQSPNNDIAAHSIRW